MSVNLNDEYFDFKTLEEFDLNLFLTANKNQTPESFLLHSKYNTKKLNWFLAEQLKTYPKAAYKLPTFVARHCWFTAKSYEQSSSESSALFKTSLFSGKRILDLSGGLGIDDWAFSKSFQEVISLDPDNELNELVRFNWKQVGVSNCIRIDEKAEDYLANSTHEQFDLVYLDADRRANQNRKLGIEDGSPNFFELKEQIFNCSKKVLLKLSPLIDINYCIKTLPYIQSIWVVSVDQEVKEILCLLDNSTESLVKIHVVEISKTGEISDFTKEANFVNTDKLETTETQNLYFFEPSAALIKSGLSKHFALENHYQLIEKNTYYFTGNNLTNQLQNHGRIFRIQYQSKFSKNGFLNYLKLYGIEKLNISARNFGMDADEIVKNFKLKTGSDDYFFFSKNNKGEKLFFHCRKIKV